MEKKSREGVSDFKGSDYQVLNSMKDLVRVIDKDGVIIFANKSMINSMPINPIGVNCYWITVKIFQNVWQIENTV